jgi:AcrR family transcriptional regulator
MGRCDPHLSLEERGKIDKWREAKMPVPEIADRLGRAPSMIYRELKRNTYEDKELPELTRHRHLYRGLFRCATCYRAMIPERQKAHVYYRCQTRECPKNIIREDRLEAAIERAYLSVTMSPATARDLQQKWLEWLHSDAKQAAMQSLDLRRAKLEHRLNRLTDLLLDGVIGRAEHQTRKSSLTKELDALEAERAEFRKSDLSAENLAKFLELITRLAELHIWLKPDEKRYLLENCFSNRTVSGNEPCLEPYPWLQSQDFTILTPLVTQLGPLLELLFKSGISRETEITKAKFPRWKYNLKSQRPDRHTQRRKLFHRMDTE